MSRFTKAVKTRKKLRMGLMGPSGSGKTYTALSIGSGLGQRIAVVCTEHGAANLYAHKFAFDIVELETFDPREYIECMHDAAREGYDVIVIDSLTHAWSGKGGALELVDEFTKRNKGGNSYTAWRDVTPLHNQLIDAMLGYPGHVIATLRTKTEYVMEEDSRGKKVPRKVGMAPIQRDGMEYEFDVVADLNLEHDFIVTKTRLDELDGLIVNRAGAPLAEKILASLSGADPTPVPAPKPNGNGNGNGDKEDNRPFDVYMRDAAKAANATIQLFAEGVFDDLVQSGNIFRPEEDVNHAYMMDSLARLDIEARPLFRRTVKNAVRQWVKMNAAAEKVG